MKWKNALTIGLFAIATGANAATDSIVIRDLSFRDANGNRVQQLMTVVNAPVSNVWAAFTTDDGFKRWAVPVTHITLGNDGMIESSYQISSKIGDPENIRNRIVAFLPQRLLILQNAHVPKGAPFDPVLIATLRTIIMLEPIDATHTRVTEAQVGYGTGPGYDTMYERFRSGNAYSLQQLAQSFITGPIDWAAEAARASASVDKPASH